MDSETSDWSGSTEDPFAKKPPVSKAEDDGEIEEEGGPEARDVQQDETPEIAADNVSGIRRFIDAGEFKFLPVLGFDTANNLSNAANDEKEETFDDLLRINDDEDLLWWTEKSALGQHPFILINPTVIGQYAERAGKSAKEVFGLDPETMFIFVDSGGYQVVSNEDSMVVDSAADHSFNDHHLHPETVLDWQMENGNIGPILDMPPYGMGGTSQFSSSDWTYDEWLTNLFEPRLEKTVENAEKQWDHYVSQGCPDNYMPIGVVHGQTAMDSSKPWSLLEEWYQEVSSAGDFNGWALSPKPSTSLGQIALYLGFASNYLTDADYIHVLQVGAFAQKTLCNYYSMLQDDHFLTSDASTFSNGGRFRAYFMPHGWGQSRRIRVTERKDDEGNHKIDDAIDIDRFPCRCPVCKKLSAEYGTDILTSDESSSFATSIMNMHNLECMLQDDAIIDSLLNGIGPDIVEGLDMNEGSRKVRKASNVFWKIMQDSLPEHMVVQLYWAMRFVKIAVEEDLDSAIEAGFNIPWSFNQSTENQSWTILRGGSALDW